MSSNERRELLNKLFILTQWRHLVEHSNDKLNSVLVTFSMKFLHKKENKTNGNLTSLDEVNIFIGYPYHYNSNYKWRNFKKSKKIRKLNT